MKNTIPVLIEVSFHVGHVTFEASCRTCLTNSPGLTFAISFRLPVYYLIQLLPVRRPGWQEWRDSNPQPPVLETGALAS